MSEAVSGLLGLVREELAALRGELVVVREEVARQKERVAMLDERNRDLENELRRALGAVEERSVATAAVVEEKGRELIAVKGERAVLKEEVGRQNERVVMLEGKNQVLERELNELRRALGVVGERSAVTAAVVEERGKELTTVKELIGVKAELIAVNWELTAVKGELAEHKRTMAEQRRHSDLKDLGSEFTSHASLTPASTPFPADPLHRHHCSSAMVGCCFTAIGAQQCAAMKGGASAAMLTSGGDNLGPSQLVQDRCWWLGKWKGVGESQGEGKEG
ncbi:unnamed protein product [Closterium sp. NIES-65]|nr:unnamed protein product [Closterium sp. NIES-65]